MPGAVLAFPSAPVQQPGPQLLAYHQEVEDHAIQLWLCLSAMGAATVSSPEAALGNQDVLVHSGAPEMTARSGELGETHKGRLWAIASERDHPLQVEGVSCTTTILTVYSFVRQTDSPSWTCSTTSKQVWNLVSSLTSVRHQVPSVVLYPWVVHCSDEKKVPDHNWRCLAISSSSRQFMWRAWGSSYPFLPTVTSIPAGERCIHVH